MSDTVSRWSEDWSAHEESAFGSGVHGGWDSANYAEAYGRGRDVPGGLYESFLQEGIRRGNAKFLREDERRAWLLGWLMGGVHFGEGNYPSGAPVGADVETMTQGQPGRAKL